MTTALLIEAIGAIEPLQIGAEFDGTTTVEWTRAALLGMLGYGLLAGAGAGALAFVYRARTVRELPIGPALLGGLALPTGWLTVDAVRHGAVIADSPLVHYTTGSYLLGVVVVGTVVAAVGHRLGDHLACGTYGIDRIDARGRVARLVQSAGLAVTLTLPDSIDDAEGYSAVDGETKRALAGQRLLFPSGLSLATLQARVKRRIESDYDVSYAHLELTDAGEVGGLSLGDRQSGISPTLAPDRVAVAIAGDPSPQATTGDPIEVWTDDAASSQLVTTGTLRATAGSVTTLIVDADDAMAFSPGDRYRLTTRSETPSEGHALVSAIRRDDAVVTTVTVEADGSLESEFAGWLPGTVLAIDRGDDELTLPADNEPLEAGDTVYIFGTPDELADIAAGLDESSAFEVSDSNESGESRETTASSDPPDVSPEAAK